MPDYTYTHSQRSALPPPTLDLHGRGADDAVSDVTLFLDRYRRTVDSSPYKEGEKGGSSNRLFVKIITGSGSHSSHGPILRSIVQRLLEKRGMDWSLERGGGAFQVDALSGFELYGKGEEVDSKVVLAQEVDFHQLAASLKSKKISEGYAGPSNSKVQNNTADIPRSSDPLPSQVALEDDALRTAVQLSIADCQKIQKKRNHMMEKYENELVRAISESELLDHAQNSALEEHFEETLLKIACEESLVEEQKQRDRILPSDENYENALLLALEQSTLESMQPIKSEEDDHHMQQALAESKASLTECREASNSEDDLLEKAIAESLAEEEKRNTYRREQEMLAISQDAALIEEVKRLSLKQQQQKEEEYNATKAVG